MSKLKTFAEDNLNGTQQLKCIIGKVENSVGKRNKSTAYRCQCSAVCCLIEVKKCKSKKGHNSEKKKKKKHFEWSPLIVLIALWIVNTDSRLHVNNFGNYRDITKVSAQCQRHQGYSNTSSFL